jgi:hypothetical protein
MISGSEGAIEINRAGCHRKCMGKRKSVVKWGSTFELTNFRVFSFLVDFLRFLHSLTCSLSLFGFYDGR